jgi:hypothetical protein
VRSRSVRWEALGGKVGTGRAAAHPRSGRCSRNDFPAFALSRGPSWNSLCALKRASLKQPRRVRARCALRARRREARANTGAPCDRCAAARPAPPLQGTRLALRHTTGLSSRQAVPGGGDLWGGCDARSGGGRACALRKLTRRSCLNGGPFKARSEFCDADPRPSSAAKSERERSPQQCEPPPGTACRGPWPTLARRVRFSGAQAPLPPAAVPRWRGPAGCRCR